MRFEAKTVIVTGAASGIGAACLRRLREEGAAVVAADLDTSEIRAATGLEEMDELLTVDADVSDPRQAAEIVEAGRRRFGSLHGLVNCAGVRGVGTVMSTDLEAWNAVLGVNLSGTFNVCHAFADAVRAQGDGTAAIVNVSSAAGIRGVPNRISYVASKFGVVGLTQAMALELAPAVRVNAVAPGTIRTPMTASLFETPDAVATVRAGHPLGREGQPEEVAAAIVFLLSDDASFISGAILPVDGAATVGMGAIERRERWASGEPS